MLSTTATSYSFSDYSSVKISESWMMGVVSMSYLGLNTLWSLIFFILTSCILTLYVDCQLFQGFSLKYELKYVLVCGDNNKP